MRADRIVLTVALVGIGAALTADDKKPKQQFPEAAAAILEKATELEVYSLAGNAREGDKDAWRGAKLLGKTTVKKEEDRKALVATIKQGVEEGGRPAKCFIPRHGVSAKHDGKTVELVICFECGWIHVFVDGQAQKPNLTISGAPHKALDAVLTAANVPLDKAGK